MRQEISTVHNLIQKLIVVGSFEQDENEEGHMQKEKRHETYSLQVKDPMSVSEVSEGFESELTPEPSQFFSRILLGR